MRQSQTKPVIVTDKLVPGLFFQIDRVQPTNDGRVRVTGHPTADSGVQRITATVETGRARELGLVN